MVARKPRTDKKPERVREDYVKEVDGVEITLPSLSYLKPGLVRKIRRLGEVDAMYTLIEMVLNDDQLAALDEMEPGEYEEFLEGWRIHSGIALGESSASTR